MTNKIEKLDYTKQLLTIGAIAVLAYVFVCYLYTFEKTALIDWFAALNLVERDRIIARSDNLFIGITTITGITIISLWLENRLQRKGFSTLFGPERRFYAYDPAWFARAARLATAICIATIPLFFLRSVLSMNWLYVEDGPMEYTTVAGYMLAAAISARTATYIIKNNVGERIIFGLSVAMTLAFLFVAMEEIS